MKQWTKLLVSVAAAALLAACGGGSDDGEGGGDGGGDGGGSVVAADKYVGTWVLSCTVYGAGESEKETVVISKESSTKVNVAFELTSYANETCAGTGTVQNFTGSATIDGQTTVTYHGNAETFDRLTATIDGEGTLKWLGTVRSNGNQMVIDFGDNDVDSSTVYPSNPNEGESVYAKQLP